MGSQTGIEELAEVYGPERLGELLAGMNGTLIRYGRKPDSLIRITDLGKMIALGTVRDIFQGTQMNSDSPYSA